MTALVVKFPAQQVAQPTSSGSDEQQPLQGVLKRRKEREDALRAAQEAEEAGEQEEESWNKDSTN